MILVLSNRNSFFISKLVLPDLETLLSNNTTIILRKRLKREKHLCKTQGILVLIQNLKDLTAKCSNLLQSPKRGFLLQSQTPPSSQKSPLMAESICRNLRDGALEGEHAPALTIRDTIDSPFGFDVFAHVLSQLSSFILAGKSQSR